MLLGEMEGTFLEDGLEKELVRPYEDWCCLSSAQVQVQIYD